MIEEVFNKYNNSIIPLTDILKQSTEVITGVIVKCKHEEYREKMFLKGILKSRIVDNQLRLDI